MIAREVVMGEERSAEESWLTSQDKDPWKAEELQSPPSPVPGGDSRELTARQAGVVLVMLEGMSSYRHLWLPIF